MRYCESSKSLEDDCGVDRVPRFRLLMPECLARFARQCKKNIYEWLNTSLKVRKQGMSFRLPCICNLKSISVLSGCLLFGQISLTRGDACISTHTPTDFVSWTVHHVTCCTAAHPYTLPTSFTSLHPIHICISPDRVMGLALDPNKVTMNTAKRSIGPITQPHSVTI